MLKKAISDTVVFIPGASNRISFAMALRFAEEGYRG